MFTLPEDMPNQDTTINQESDNRESDTNQESNNRESNNKESDTKESDNNQESDINQESVINQEFNTNQESITNQTNQESNINQTNQTDTNNKTVINQDIVTNRDSVSEKKISIFQKVTNILEYSEIADLNSEIQNINNVIQTLNDEIERSNNKVRLLCAKKLVNAIKSMCAEIHSLFDRSGNEVYRYDKFRNILNLCVSERQRLLVYHCFISYFSCQFAKSPDLLKFHDDKKLDSHVVELMKETIEIHDKSSHNDTNDVIESMRVLLDNYNYRYQLCPNIISLSQTIMSDYCAKCETRTNEIIDHFEICVSNVKKNYSQNYSYQYHTYSSFYFDFNNMLQCNLESHTESFNIDNYSWYSSKGQMLSDWPLYMIMNGKITDDFLLRYV